MDKCDSLRGIKVINKEEWKRLNDQLISDNIEQAKIEERKLANERLKKQSEDMVKNWTNTFLGARQKKLDERAKRLANEEAAKVALDLEEAKFQAEQRKAAIEEAKLKLYYETDRMKTFHSALSLTEVLKERDAQLEFKDLCLKRNADKDKVYVERMKAEFAEATQKEKEKAAERRAKNIQMAAELKTQIQNHLAELDKERTEKLKEGEQLKQILAEDQLERERLAKLDREETIRLREDYKRQMEGNEQMRMIERLKEEEEDEKCRIFAAAKKKMTTLKVLKEREIFKAREEEMERIRKALAEQLEKQIEDEDERIARAVAQKEEADRLNEAEKARIRAKQLAEIEANRLETIQRHREEAEQARLAELEEVRARNEADKAMTEYLNTCLTRAKEKTKALSREYLEQQRQKAEDTRKSREEEIRLAGEGNKLAQLEEEIFQDYTKRVIEHCKANKRNVFPLEAAARPTPSLGLVKPTEDGAKNSGEQNNNNSTGSSGRTPMKNKLNRKLS